MPRFDDFDTQVQADDLMDAYADDMHDYYRAPYSNNYPDYSDSPF